MWSAGWICRNGDPNMCACDLSALWSKTSRVHSRLDRSRCSQRDSRCYDKCFLKRNFEKFFTRSIRFALLCISAIITYQPNSFVVDIQSHFVVKIEKVFKEICIAILADFVEKSSEFQRCCRTFRIRFQLPDILLILPCKSKFSGYGNATKRNLVIHMPTGL